MREFIIILLFAMSLCADCFAVSVCSSVTLRRIKLSQTLVVAVVFAFVQASLLLVGWFFGDIFVSYIQKIAKFIGFILLLYVSLSMLRDAFKSECESLSLGSLKNVILGAVATSIDAFAVGISLSMAMISVKDISIRSLAVFACTFLSVIAGIYGGHKIGCRFGRIAEFFGAVVLLLIAFDILFDFI